MRLRFRRTVSILPGVRLNVGLKSLSVSLGTRGARYTVGTRGQQATVGIPGTGFSVTQPISSKPLAAQRLVFCLVAGITLVLFASFLIHSLAGSP
jgi:Protein of unknown function (DUF4236)